MVAYYLEPEEGNLDPMGRIPAWRSIKHIVQSVRDNDGRIFDIDRFYIYEDWHGWDKIIRVPYYWREVTREEKIRSGMTAGE